MPQGDKSAYTKKQKRQAKHIEGGYRDRGLSEKEAERRAWSTVNARSGGGKLSGSGRKGTGGQSSAQRSAAARKGWETRRRNEMG